MESDEKGAGPGAALLLVIGEPFSEDHKTQILAEITKGFRCWDSEETGININEQLAHIANRASLGEEGSNGERTIQHTSEHLAVEIIINPLTQTVKNSVKKLLVSPSPVKYIIHAGHVFQDTGAWVLQDDTFEFRHLAQVFKNVEVENGLKQNIEASLTIHTVADTNWGKSISKADFTNMVRIQLNPPEKQEDMHGILQFTAYVGSFVKVVPLTSLLRASEQFGNISFTRPTLYIFPGCEGDSALFGVNGFNLLVNGGYNRRACFWDFARHLDRVDAMLLTHLGSDNIFSINTVLERKKLDNIHPQIGYLYSNVPEKLLQSVDSESVSEKDPSLVINLATEGAKLTSMAKELGIAPHPCTRDDKAKTTDPINLYHKLGHGSLDMYALNPIADSKELKDFYQQWTKQAPNLGTNGPFSSQNALSVCTLLVWKPYNMSEKIVRILFPGNAPQHKIAEGLEKMKTFDFLKRASCTGKDLLKPVAVKKVRPGSASTSRTTASAKTERLTASARGATRTDRKSPMTSPMKTSRSIKDDVTNRLSKPKEIKEKETRTRPSSVSTTKTSTTKKSTTPTSPRKTPSKSPSPPKTSPAKTGPSASATKSPTKSPSPTKVASSKVATPEPSKPEPPKEEAPKPEPSKLVSPLPQPAELSNGLGGNIEEIPAAVPEPPMNNLDLEPKSETNQVEPHSLSNGVNQPKEAWVNDGITPSETDVEPKSGMYTDNGHLLDNDGEEIKPQALPDPPIVLDRSEEIPSNNLSNISKEDHLTSDAENLGHISNPDPASTPIFDDDEPQTFVDQKQVPVEVQYGIGTNGNGRAMGGIQEVDEEDELSDTSNICGDDDNQGVGFERNYSGAEEINTYKKTDGSHISNNHPFDSYSDGVEKDELESLEKYSKSVDDQDQSNSSFDPMAHWDQPMGLPSPPPRSTSSTKSTTSRSDTKTTRTTTTTSKPAARAGTTRPTSTTKKSSRSSPPTAKIPPMPPVTPFYFDLTYIPNHGDILYCDVEFFKRVRARYYVLSSLSPNPKVLDSLVEAKATWEQDDLEVTIIPTYDNETLRHWIGLNKEKLQELHIDLTPAVSRCTIQLQDLETSLPAYRLEV